MAVPTDPLLHGVTPWRVGREDLRVLLEALERPRWAAIGDRVELAEGDELLDTLVADPMDAGLVVLGVAPADLEDAIGQLTVPAGTLVASPDVRVPGWRAMRDMTCGVHVFHVYEVRAASFDEVHQLAVVHPQYDGFVVTTLTAWRHIEFPRLIVTGALADAVSPHHLEGPLRRGQQRPIDIELHPGIVPATGLTGALELLDGNVQLGTALQLTVATTPGIEAVLAGRVAGPLEAAEFDEVVDALTSGRTSPRRVARRITGAEEGRGWKPWRRRG